ncbi:MAG: 4'-phosphopantetheinyl transferase superfamily protein [Oscillospiraceae bacterium]|nr:4'-phosphopantetheinyl transferase superfamily protein [Oscillospiraceae bacterium]
MIYFVRRPFEADNNKLSHKKQLKSSLNEILTDVLAQLDINYTQDNLVYGEHGKPYLKNINNVFFNISHCHELGVCTVSDTEVGIDAENIRKWSPLVPKRVFSDRENNFLENAENKDEAFFRLWTLKESFVKAIGIGISYPLKTCEFLFDNENIIASGCDGCSFLQIILNDTFICSACVKNTDKYSNKLYRITETQQVFSLNL